MILIRVETKMLPKNIITIDKNHQLKTQETNSAFPEGHNVSMHNQEHVEVTKNNNDGQNSSNFENYKISLNSINPILNL